MNDLEPEPRSWNIWLTLMVIAIAFTIAVAVAEYMGAFRPSPYFSPTISRKRRSVWT